VQCIEHGLLIEDAITTLFAGNDFTTRTQIALFRSLEPLDEPSDIRRDTMTPARARQEYRVRMIGKSGIATACPTDFTNPPHLGLPREFTERASAVAGRGSPSGYLAAHRRHPQSHKSEPIRKFFENSRVLAGGLADRCQ